MGELKADAHGSYRVGGDHVGGLGKSSGVWWGGKGIDYRIGI